MLSMMAVCRRMPRASYFFTCFRFKVPAEYMERREQQKEEYLKENPSYANLFAEADVDDDMIWHWMMLDVGGEEIKVDE